MTYDWERSFSALPFYKIVSELARKLIPAPAPLDDRLRVLLWGSPRSGKTSILYRWKLASFIPTVPTVGMLEETFTYATNYKISRVQVAEIGRDPQSLEKPNSAVVIPIRKFSSDEDDCDDDHDNNRHNDSNSKKRRRRKTNRGRFACRCIKWCCACCLRRRAKAKVVDFAIQAWTRAITRTHAVVYVVDSSCRRSLLEMFDDVNFVMSHDALRHRSARIVILANKQDVVGAVRPEMVEKMLDLPKSLRSRCRIIGCSALTGQNVEEALSWLTEVNYNRQDYQMTDRYS